MTVLVASVLGVAVWGPGLEGWAASRAILAGEQAYVHRDSPAPSPAMLAANERRRVGPVVRLALAVAGEATVASGLDAGALACVFASSNGDGVVVGGILDALARAEPGERVVSPTQFHNSVHNAAAGYWSIANRSRQPATCLGAHDSTWAAGLLTAMAEVAEGHSTLLVCYDHPLPPPLDALRPTESAFGAGLVLAPALPERPSMEVEYQAAPAPPPASLGPALDALRDGNAAARALPLLCALARGGTHHQALAFHDARLSITVHA